MPDDLKAYVVTVHLTILELILVAFVFFISKCVLLPAGLPGFFVAVLLHFLSV